MFGLLLILFITVPLAEIYLLVAVADEIGAGNTIAIVVVTGFAGAALARHQGLVTVRRFQENLAAGRLPQGALLDGLLILVAGVVLLTPGLITDVAGFMLLTPPIRRVVARWLAHSLKGRVRTVHTGDQRRGTPGGSSGSPPPPGASRPGSTRPDDVIDVDFSVRDERDE